MLFKSSSIANAIVTILILIDGFLQYKMTNKLGHRWLVTILILIDGFLQYNYEAFKRRKDKSHNPYFNRWFSAMQFMDKYVPLIGVTILILIDGFLQWV